MDMTELKKKSSEIARDMRAIYFEDCTGLNQHVDLNTQKFANSIGKNLNYTITSSVSTILGEHILGMIYRKEASAQAVILIADRNNGCWKRFTYIKEVCQLYIDEKREDLAEVTEIVEALLTQDFESDYCRSEYLAAYTAINIMIPEHLEAWARHKVNTENYTLFQVATQLKVPRKFVEFKMREWHIDISD